MSLRAMVQQLREDVALLERGSTPATHAAELTRSSQNVAKQAQELAKLVADLDALDADGRRKLATLFRDLRDGESQVRNALSRVGTVLVVKDLVTLPKGSSGYS